MSDHFQQAPSAAAPIARTGKQLIHIARNFQQLPLILFSKEHPIQPQTNQL